MVIVVLGWTGTAGCGANPARTVAATAATRSPDQTITITYAPAGPASSATLDLAARLMRSRARQLSLHGTDVTVSAGHVVVTGPRAEEPVLRSLAISAVTRFRAVLLDAQPGGKTAGNPRLVKPGVRAIFNRLTCKPGEQGPAWHAQVGYSSAADWDNPAKQTVACGSDGTKYALDTAAVLGDDLAAASARYVASTSQWMVYLLFNRDGAAALARLTTRLCDRYCAGAATNADGYALAQVAIAVDGSVVSAPEIQSPITDGVAQIYGNFPRITAQELAAQLQSGHLPVSLKVISVRTLHRDQAATSRC